VTTYYSTIHIIRLDHTKYIKFERQNLSPETLEMIIPIRCMNCGNVLADKWLFYQQKVKEMNKSDKIQPIYMDGKTVPDTAERKVLEYLGLTRYCCRKHMLTHVDLIDKI
jgi:DNA-directed RNA polymerase I, II, and III subunit RPABC5